MIVVIGAGPAGLAAALAAAQSEHEIVVLDSAPRIGGQYWRHQREVVGYKAERARELFIKVQDKKNISIISNSSVWSAEEVGDEYRINYIRNGEEKSLVSEKIIIATGAYDRSLPFPGWDKPGVMTPGAAQALLKGQGVVAGKRIIVAGSGPFLLPVATGLAQAGAEIVGLLEAQSPLRWLLSPFAIIGNSAKILELIHYRNLLRKYSIPITFGKTITGFSEGIATISKVDSKLRPRLRESEEISCDVVAIGWGFQPDMTVGGILGCAQRIDDDGNTIFTVDNYQRASQENIWIAGEATGIGGADLALLEGEVAGLSATGQQISSVILRRRNSKKRFASALKKSYPVASGWTQWMDSETVICRCEEVKAEEVAAAVAELGAEDSRGTKLFTRCGMGLCQGRVCSRNVSEYVAQLTNTQISKEERISYSNRPIATPISLGLLADGKSNH